MKLSKLKRVHANVYSTWFTMDRWMVGMSFCRYDCIRLHSFSAFATASSSLSCVVYMARIALFLCEISLFGVVPLIVLRVGLEECPDFRVGFPDPETLLWSCRPRGGACKRRRRGR